MSQAPALVVAVDPEKQPDDPLRLGVRLARLAGASIHLVTVFEHLPLVHESDRQRELREAARTELLEVAEDLLEGVSLADVEVIGASSPARALQEVSEREDVHLVVIGSTTRGPLRRVLPGAIADRLLSGAAASVAIAPHGYARDAPDGLRTVGIAFDGSGESQHALRAARALAKLAGARLRILTVHPHPTFGAGTRSAVPEATVSSSLERELRSALDEAVEGSGDVPTEGVFASGRPVEVLVEHSRDLDLLLAGSRSYGPLGAVLLGGTTHDLMRLAECPLVVTPRDRGLELAGAAA